MVSQVQRVLFVLAALGLVAGPRLWGQERNASTGMIVPKTETEMRQELEKLESWGVEQLLKTEREVDHEQKRRAHLSANPHELALLAGDEDSGVRFYVATNRYTPLAVLQRLAGDPAPQVRSGVALTLEYNPAAAESRRLQVGTAATQLAADSHVLVRLGLAENTALHPPIYRLLAADSEPAVRQKVAQNIRVDQQALVALVRDSVESVQVQALLHRNVPVEVLVEMSQAQAPLLRQAVGQNPNTPGAVLDQLAQDPEVTVRRAVARHPGTGLATLERMGQSEEDEEVLLGLATHPNASRDLLFRLCQRAEVPVVEAAKAQLAPLLRSEIREDLLERWYSR